MRSPLSSARRIEVPDEEDDFQRIESLLAGVQAEKNGDIRLVRLERAFGIASSHDVLESAALRRSVCALLAQCCVSAQRGEPPGAAAFLSLVARNIFWLDPFAAPLTVEALKQTLYDTVGSGLKHDDAAPLAQGLRCVRHLATLLPGDREVDGLMMYLASCATQLSAAALATMREHEAPTGAAADLLEHSYLTMGRLTRPHARAELCEALLRKCTDALPGSRSPEESRRLERLARAAAMQLPGGLRAQPPAKAGQM